jgi:hypothetical protein
MDIPEEITSIDQLRWYRMALSSTGGRRAMEILQPCRVLSIGEVVKWRRNNPFGNERTGKITHDGGKDMTVIQYMKYPDTDRGIYKCVLDSSLVPFGYASRDGSSVTFNDDYLNRYMQQESKTVTRLKLEKTRQFLKRAFDHAIATEKKTREEAERDLREYYDGSSDDDDDVDGVGPLSSDGQAMNSKRVQFEVLECDDDGGNDDDGENRDEMDDLDIPYTQAITFDPDDFGEVEGPSNEPIRPGDVIEYYCPIYVSGDARGLRHATVLSVDPNNVMPLVLSNGEGLPSSTKVKRIKVMSGNELVDHPGIFRSMDQFKLTTRGSATAADAIAMEASRFRGIMKKNIDRLRDKAEADGFAPMDMLVNIRGVTTQSKGPTQTKASIDSSLRGKKRETLPSSSLDDSSDSETPKITLNRATIKPRIEKASDAIPRTGKTTGNKENNLTEIGDVKKSRAGNLPSLASLGSSLSTSDNSSIESTHINLGKNHKKMTQCETSSLPKTKKLKANLHSNAKTYDLSLSSDEDEAKRRNKRQKRMGKSTHATSKEWSSNSSVSSESSLEITYPLRIRKSPPKTSPITSLSSLKRQSKLSSALDNRNAAPSLQSSSHKNIDKDKILCSSSKALHRKEQILPSSPSSSTWSFSRSTSSIQKQKRKETKHRTESTSRNTKRLCLSDTAEIPSSNMSYPKSKSRPLSSFGSSSSDDGDDVGDEKKVARIGSTWESRKSLESCDQPRKSTERMESAGKREMGNLESFTSGWTQGKAGWEKSSATGFGFRFGRFK